MLALFVGFSSSCVMEGVLRPPVCFEEMVVPLLIYLPFEYRNSALLRGVISMNSVGRWPIFFFISYHP
jgi:hypothetical protein